MCKFFPRRQISFPFHCNSPFPWSIMGANDQAEVRQMVRSRGALGMILALCLLASACGGMGRPLPPPSESGAESVSQSRAEAPEPVRAEPSPPPAGGNSEEAPPPEAEPSGESSGPEEEPGSSQPSSVPEEASQPEPEPPSQPEAPPEESSSLPPEESSSQPPASQPEEEPPASLVPEPEPEPLPQGCRWMNITEASVLGFINRERGKQGLTPLTLDADLTAAARVRAEELFRGNYVSHTRPGGEPWETVLGELCIEYARAAENLAWSNHGVGEEIGAFQWFALWKDSPSHYQAMMDAQYTYCGVAVLSGPYYDGEDQSYAVALFCTY